MMLKLVTIGLFLLGVLVGRAVVTDPPVVFGQSLDPGLVPVHSFPCKPTSVSFPGWSWRVGPIDTVRITLNDGTNLSACTVYTPRGLLHPGGLTN